MGFYKRLSYLRTIKEIDARDDLFYLQLRKYYTVKSILRDKELKPKYEGRTIRGE